MANLSNRQWAKLEKQARALGAEHGRNVGSWVIDGNTTAETAARILQGYEDGDPEIMDMQPSPLSGEWADDPTPSSVLADLGVNETDESSSELLDTYEAAFSEAYWDEVIRAAKVVVS